MYSNDSTGISAGGYLIFALLSGGDYDGGIPGCGLTVASAIAQCDYGDTLLKAFSEMNDHDLDKFLQTWRNSLRTELRDNVHNLLGHRAPAIADRISDSFPDHAIVNLYLKPQTSWSVTSASVPDHTTWTFGPPSIPCIARFCQENLGLENILSLKKKFRNTLWEGMFLHMVYSVRGAFL